MGDQTDQTDPTKQYDQPEHTDEQQPHPGLTQTMQDKPDHGEDSYRAAGQCSDPLFFAILIVVGLIVIGMMPDWPRRHRR
jgi:hypothetical protein